MVEGWEQCESEAHLSVGLMLIRGKGVSVSMFNLSGCDKT